MAKHRNDGEKLLTRQQIIKKYNITKKHIQAYFPEA